MTLDLTQFHEIFFEESFEALDQMEAALLKLSAGEVDAELINTIFRVAHSIKGGAATFAFNEVAGFTHVLETLLDQLRAGKRQVRPDIVDVLLRSGDAMRAMLSATQRKEAIDSAGVAQLRAELERIMSEAPSAAGSAAPEQRGRCAGQVGRRRIRAVAGLAHQVHSGPRASSSRQRSAAHPARARDARTAQSSVDAGGIPPVNDLDPEVCRLRWNLEVLGEIDRAACARGIRVGRERMRAHHRAYRRRDSRRGSE
jgi:two-component system chemotaxis sensor kinase CheA